MMQMNADVFCSWFWPLIIKKGIAVPTNETTTAISSAFFSVYSPHSAGTFVFFLPQMTQMLVLLFEASVGFTNSSEEIFPIWLQIHQGLSSSVYSAEALSNFARQKSGYVWTRIFNLNWTFG
jgi:hypothetical protein